VEGQTDAFFAAGLNIQMTIESQTSKSADTKVAELKTNEVNLCDVNSQLCDSDIHTVPVDLDIQTKSQPEKENLMAKVRNGPCYSFSPPQKLIKVAGEGDWCRWPHFIRLLGIRLLGGKLKTLLV
jgi:hypothetical protein